mgnify:CR=1 FL=1
MEESNEIMPVYVKVNEYKEVLEVVNLIKNKIKDARQTLEDINRLKNEEDAELEIWHTSIEEVERKIDFIDKIMFEPEAL